jgi:archaellum biogenesis protein FlaJ (TadC family)
LIFILSIVTVAIIRYLLVEIEIENRRREVEKVLPDLLRVIAANIGSGLTPIVALRSAARPEFGVISKELKYITTRSMSTDSMDEIINEIQKSIRSDLLNRVLMVFTSSLRSGGDIIRALEMSANDIQRIYELHDTLVAQTSMYTTFLLFGMIITMPFLLAVSINVMELMGNISTAHHVSYVSAYMDIGFPTISGETTTIISLIVLLGSSLTASVALSIIRTGKRIEGIKYFPLILFSSVIVFFISKEFIVPFIVGILG